MGVIKQYIAGLSAAFGAFCLGASIGWSGPMMGPILSGEAYKFSPSSNEWSWASSLLTLGAGCMCVPVGILISAFGRKLTMLALIPPYLLGWAAIIYPINVYLLLLGRFVIGACGGAFCVTAPMYTTEIAQLDIRGVMGCFFQLLIVHGVLYGFIVGAYLKPLIVNILCGILPLIFFVIFIWMPESPVYLLQKGKTEKAEKAMKWLRGDDADISGEMSAMAADSKKEKAKCSEAFSRKVTVKGLFISIMLMLFQQLTGINAILFYATSIFMMAGDTGMTPDQCTILIGVVMVISTIVAILLIERAGRKLLLLVSAAVMCVTTLIVGIFFQFLQEANIGFIAVIAVCIFIIGFSIGFGPVPWLVMAELFAEDVKPICGAIAGTSNWLFAFIVTNLFPVCLDALGSGPTFFIFAIISFLACVFIVIFVPETRGKTLNEIQALLGGE